MKFLLYSLILMLVTCSALASDLPSTKDDAQWAKDMLSSMTLHQKVCQLFFITPEPISKVSSVTKVNQRVRTGLQNFPVGGIILFPVNITGHAQLISLTAELQAAATSSGCGIPLFIGVDEEGGGVARVGNKLRLKEKPPSAGTLGAKGDVLQAQQAGSSIGSYLYRYGFNLNFAPVADVRTTLKDTEIQSRAFSDDPHTTAKMVAAYVKGLQGEGILATLKHFPGHGSAVGNSHDGRSISTRTQEQWMTFEWLPFQAGLDAGAQILLMSHQTAAVIDNQSPASLSQRIVTEFLRETLNFDGIVITDALRMNAITNFYSSEEACVLALLAGVDMLLLPKNFTNAYEGIMTAINQNRLTEERIDQSVYRILLLKRKSGMIHP